MLLGHKRVDPWVDLGRVGQSGSHVCHYRRFVKKRPHFRRVRLGKGFQPSLGGGHCSGVDGVTVQIGGRPSAWRCQAAQSGLMVGRGVLAEYSGTAENSAIPTPLSGLNNKDLEKSLNPGPKPGSWGRMLQRREADDDDNGGQMRAAHWQKWVH